MVMFRSIFVSFIALGIASHSLTAKAETFQEALISAYNSNPSLLAARAQVKEIDENYIQARSQGRPSANLAGSLGISALRSSGSFVPGLPGETFRRDGTPIAAQVEVIQPLYQGGRVRALKNQAKAGIFSAREQLRNTEQDLLQQAANAYVDVLRDEDVARVRRNDVRVLARQEMAAKDRFDVGVGTKTDIAQAQSRLAAAQAGLAGAESQLQSSRATYTRLIGHLPVDLQPVPHFELPPTLTAALDIARQNNPGLAAAIYNKDASKAAIDVAKSALKPVVSLNGTVGGQREQIAGLPTNDQASLTAQFTMPLYTGGNNKSRIRQAKQAEVRMGFEIRDIERAIVEAVKQIWAQLDAARLTLKANETQVSAAEVAFEGVVLEQSVGTRTTLDVLDAEQEVLNAKLAELDAERNLNVAIFQLLTVLGVFDAEGIRLPIERYNPAENLNDIRNDKLKRLSSKFISNKPDSVADKDFE